MNHRSHCFTYVHHKHICPDEITQQGTVSDEVSLTACKETTHFSVDRTIPEFVSFDSYKHRIIDERFHEFMETCTTTLSLIHETFNLTGSVQLKWYLYYSR